MAGKLSVGKIVMTACAAGALSLGALEAGVKGQAMPLGVSTSQPATQPAKTKEQRKEEDTARVLNFFQVNQPYAYEQAKALQKSEPATFDQMISKTVGTVRRLEDLKKKNPTLFDLKMKNYEATYQTLELAKQIKRPDLSAGDRDSLQKQLLLKLTEQFEIGQKIRQAQIDDLQKELSECAQTLQERAAEKDERIKKRMDDLMQPTPASDW